MVIKENIEATKIMKERASY